VDGRREGGPEEDGYHKLEVTCTQKRRLEDGHEAGQGPTRTVEPWSSSSSYKLEAYGCDWVIGTFCQLNNLSSCTMTLGSSASNRNENQEYLLGVKAASA